LGGADNIGIAVGSYALSKAKAYRACHHTPNITTALNTPSLSNKTKAAILLGLAAFLRLNRAGRLALLSPFHQSLAID